MKKKVITTLLTLLLLTGCSGGKDDSATGKSSESENTTGNVTDGSYSNSVDTFQEETLSFEDDLSSQEKETFPDATVKDISSLSDDLTLTEGGTYLLTGDNSDLTVTVNSTESVTLILSGANIASNHGPALSVKNANSFTLHIASGTENTLQDSEKNTEEAAILVKKVPLSMEGQGFLRIKGKGLSTDDVDSGVALQAAKGIQIKETHLIVSESNSHAINTKAGLSVEGAKLSLVSEKDGIHSKEGGVTLKDATLISDTKGDAIDVLTAIEIDNVIANVKTTGAYTQYDKTLDTDGSLYEDSKYILKNGEYVKIGTDEMGRYSTRYYLTQKCKGFKTDGSLLIKGGDFYFDTDDDSLSGDESVTLLDGDFVFSCKDQAINSDGKVLLGSETTTQKNEDFRIKIFASYEGIQGESIDFYDGHTYIVSSDDGINATTDTESSPSMNFHEFATVYVNAEGDGIDSNGTITMDGGELFVFGPSNGGNGALDFDDTFTHTGGLIFAMAVAGMNEVPDTTSVNAAIATIGSYQQGDAVSLFVGSMEYSAILPKQMNNLQVILSTPDLETGKTLTIKKGIEKQGNYINNFYTGSVLGTGGEDVTTLDIVKGLTGETGGNGQRPGGPGGGPGGR